MDTEDESEMLVQLPYRWWNRSLMDVTAELLRAFASKEVLSWPTWRFLQMMEKFLETGTVISSQLEMVRDFLDSPETAPSIVRSLCQAGRLHLLRMALEQRRALASAAVDDALSTPLHVVAKHGQPAAARLLLISGADVDAVRESDGWTALHEAVVCGRGGGPVVAAVLLRSGAHVDVRNKQGQTPLQLAAAAGHGVVAQMLCSAGADITSGEEDWSKRPLLMAADRGSLGTVRALLGAGAEGGEALMWAAERGSDRAVKTLAAAGVDVTVRDGDELTPLHWAARRCGLEAVTALLEAGASKQAISKTGAVPLHWAAWGGDAAVVRLLLQGTDVGIKDNYDSTPLHYTARYSDSAEVARELLAAGADLNGRDEDGDAPLHLAASEGHINLVKLLIEGTDINITNDKDWTPLHFAANWGHLDVVKVLVDAGADKFLKTEDDETASDLWKKQGHVEKLLN